MSASMLNKIAIDGCDAALLMMPFGPADRPALGLSLLAQVLNDTGVRARVFYPNLDFQQRIGSDAYQAFCLDFVRYSAGEWLFSQVLAPVGTPNDFIESLTFQLKDSHSKPRRSLERFAEMLPDALVQAHALIDEWCAEIQRRQPSVVGLSNCYQQHTASLAIAERIKRVCPDTLVVMGGANCNDVMGDETFRRFKFLDAVVSGPGEVVFPKMARRHLDGHGQIALPGVRWRGPEGVENGEPRMPSATESELDTLPIPSFDDYFTAWNAADEMAKRTGLAPPPEPKVVIETSRGCWWGQKNHCIFCSENATSMRYRSKSADRIFTEFATLLARHPGVPISATDEILDLRLIDSVMPRLAELPQPRRIFFSVKANIRKDQLVKLVDAGVTSLQPGIESLDDEILRVMRKGVSTLQSIQLLKWCRELGITVAWAILYGFPFERPAAYAEMAALLPRLTHLAPPRTMSLSLQRYSPLFTESEKYGIRNIRPSASYRLIYDADDEGLNQLAYRFAYDCDRPQPLLSYVQPLRKAVREWEQMENQAFLFHHDEGGCLVIGDTRPTATRRVHRLIGAARLAYLSCDRILPDHEIAQALASAGSSLCEDGMEDLLSGLAEDGLMLRKDGLNLSLGVRVNPRCLPPILLMAEALAAR